MSQTEPSSQENQTPAILNEDKRSIQEEEREKILNDENDHKNSSAETPEEKRPKEGMEVKPKKIPIGGIQMPGFFTRSKSKEQCKDEDQAEGTELIEPSAEKKEENPPTQSRIKLPNPFKKTKAGESEDGEPKDKIKLLETIRMPLVSVFQKMKRSSESQNLTNAQGQAGLASMETLDDKSNTSKSNNELKNVPLNDKKDVEKQEQPEIPWTEKLKGYKIAIAGAVLFLILLIILIICITRGSKGALRTPPLRNGKYIEAITSCGKVEGLKEDSAFAFRGIPYARPPIGKLRFKYAQSLNNVEYCWNGTLNTHNATPVCLQMLSNGTITGVENCLTLDVITPYVRYDNPLPVIVLIGADSFMGGSPGKMRPSARYARSKDVVFVRPNFRMGPLGFLSLDMLSKADYPHTSGNYALSDIVEALHWIQLNIEHFGGDNSSVTLFGHKAGATLVTALSTMSDARKYFKLAWASSGSAIYPSKPRNESEMEFRSFLQHVECGNVECLMSVDAQKLFKSVHYSWRKPQPDLPAKIEDPSKRHHWMVIDGKFLKEAPREVWSRGPLPVNLVIGSTAQAGSSEILRLKHVNWTEGLIRHHVKESYIGAQNLVEETLKRYGSTYRGLSSLVTDLRITCPLYTLWTEMQNVTFYVVNQTRDGNRIADIDSDIDAILGRYEPKTPEQRRYFQAMQGLFYYYVWHGVIEQKSSGRNVLIVDQDVLPNSSYSECEFWKSKGIALSYASLD